MNCSVQFSIFDTFHNSTYETFSFQHFESSFIQHFTLFNFEISIFVGIFNYYFLLQRHILATVNACVELFYGYFVQNSLCQSIYNPYLFFGTWHRLNTEYPEWYKYKSTIHAYTKALMLKFLVTF